MNVFTNIVTVIKLKTGFCFIAWWSYDAINSKYLTFFPFPIKFLIMNVFFFLSLKVYSYRSMMAIRILKAKRIP